MAFRRGEIRLANFNPSKGTEAGKVRPCLVVQSNLLNEVDHPSTTVIPLTTRLRPGSEPLRMQLDSRERLKQDSELMLDQVRTIDNRRLSGEPLGMATPTEMLQVSEYLKILLDL